MRRLFILLLLALAPPAHAATIATCSTVAAELAKASSEPILLTGDCPAITISRRYEPRRTIIADGAKVRGLTVLKGAGNLDWLGGTIVSPKGMGANAADGYGAAVRGDDVSLIKVSFSDAEKAVLLSGGTGNAVLFSTFAGIRSDGIYVNGAKAVRVIGNVFRDFRPAPTTCTTAGTGSAATSVTTGLSSRACVALGGKWRDGSHADPVQMMNGADDGIYALNDADTLGQGIGQFDLTSDLPLNRVTIYRNKVITGGFHSITLGRCNDCIVRDNIVGTNNTNKTSVRFNSATTIACGNVAPVKGAAVAACK